MKSIAMKSLLAASALIVVGAANAATVATFSVESLGIITNPTPATGTATGVGTATLDDSGLLTMDGSAFTDLLVYGSVSAQATVESHIELNGTLVGNTFSWAAAGTEEVTGCTIENGGGGLICGGAPVGSVFPWAPDSNPLVFDLSAIGAVTVFTKNAADPGNQTTYTLTVTSLASAPEVPVPAAAWLFGSALVGLAGVARRRAA